MKTNCQIFLLLIMCVFTRSLNATIDEDLIQESIRGNVQRIKELLLQGANANARIHVQGSPLFQASAWGKIEAIRTLLAAGADPNLEIYPGNRTPLSGVLYSYMNRITNRNTALQAAALLLQSGANFGYSSVQQALKEYPELNGFLTEANEKARARLP